ncbi:hypothetical protein SNEBB_000693 [Seison nebaliae]|nr:hypothetical protein SNEBB_000693 [Seison nebaliae]
MKTSMIYIAIFALCLFVYGKCEDCEYQGKAIGSEPVEIGCDFCMCKMGKVKCQPQCEPVTCDEGETVLTSVNGCCQLCMVLPPLPK